MIIKEEHFKWHLEAFASELFICYISITSTVHLLNAHHQDAYAVTMNVKTKIPAPATMTGCPVTAFSVE